MFSYLEAQMLALASVLPLPIFATVSSFIEEVVAPIPSGPLLLLTGSLAQLQGYTVLMLVGLALAATFGKLLGSLVVYVIADKTEDILTARFAKFFGVTHTQIEAFGARLGNGWKDYVLLTLLRALPFVPSVVVSFGAGALKIPLRLFIVATVIGTVVRDMFFLYLGYAGIGAAGELLERFSAIESVVQVLIGISIVGLLVFLYLRFKKKRR